MSLREITNPQSRGSLQQKAAILVDACQLNLQGMERRVIRSGAFTGPGSGTNQALLDPDGVALVLPAGWTIMRAFAWVSTVAGTLAAIQVNCGLYAATVTPSEMAIAFDAESTVLQSTIPLTSKSTTLVVTGQVNYSSQKASATDSAITVKGSLKADGTNVSIAALVCRGIWFEIARINNAVNSNAIFA
jgi:hypothetical protein